MKIAGIIAEYNPFHNGHQYHINKTREMTGADVLVAVISGNFTQRGKVSVIDKYQKTKAALDHGVDLVIELPYYYATSQASIFAKGAVELLDLAKCDYLVFGSESNNLEELKQIAETSIDPDHLKELMATGQSYPSSYGLLSSSMQPNDILAIAYLKALKGTGITPLSLQRIGSYHDDQLREMASASAIRKAIREERDFSQASDIIVEHPLFNEDYWPYLRTLLWSLPKDYLKQIYLVSEGIENKLYKNSLIYDNYEEFVSSCISRRYTRSRIERTLVQILNQVTYSQIEALEANDTLRVLGFNETGRKYLKILQDNDVKVAVNFRSIPVNQRQLYYKSTLVYASVLDKDLRESLILKEISGPIIT